MSAQPAFDFEEAPQPCDRFEWERIVRRVIMPSGPKLLALTLATYGAADGSQVRPGTERLARVMGVSVATVKRSMGTLRELGLVVRVRQGNRWANHADEYRLTLPVDVLDLPMLDPDENYQSGDHL